MNMKANDAEIAERVTKLREYLGISQALMADRMKAAGHKWHQTTAVRVESGERPLRLTEAADLSNVLGCPLGYFTGDEPASDISKGLALAVDIIDSYRRGLRNDPPMDRAAVDMATYKALVDRLPQVTISHRES